MSSGFYYKTADGDLRAQNKSGATQRTGASLALPLLLLPSQFVKTKGGRWLFPQLARSP
jgi:hypothetical protein